MRRYYCICFVTLALFFIQVHSLHAHTSQKETALHATSSLLFFSQEEITTGEYKNGLRDYPVKSKMQLILDETEKLWETLFSYTKTQYPNLTPLYEEAHDLFYSGEKYAKKNRWNSALPKLHRASLYLESLWLLLNNNDPIAELKWQREHLRLQHKKEHHQKKLWLKQQAKQLSYVLKTLKKYEAFTQKTDHSSYNLFETNPCLSKKMKTYFYPHLLTASHSLKGALDSLFLLNRVTENREALKSAGFIPLDVRRSHSGVVVAKHPLLHKHLVKIYLEDDPVEKLNRPGWMWLAQRCEAARRIREVIETKKLEYFTVPQKWLYPLPMYPNVSSKQGRRQPVILLVEKADILSHKESVKAWKEIEPEVLDELYIIASTTLGSSYRPDNIPITLSGKFCFIDTEYLHSRPHYTSIRPYLSKKMKRYWDTLVKNGGPNYTQLN